MSTNPAEPPGADPHPIVVLAMLVYCTLLLVGFVYALGYAPATVTGPRAASPKAMIDVPAPLASTKETIGSMYFVGWLPTSKTAENHIIRLKTTKRERRNVDSVDHGPVARDPNNA
jgi:hypothetical protein